MIGKKEKRIVAGLAAAGLALSAGAFALGSGSFRGSVSAAYRAFRDPALVERRPLPSEGEGEVVAIEAPEAEGDFGPVDLSELSDDKGGSLAGLVIAGPPMPLSGRALGYVRYFTESERGREAFISRYKRSGRYRGHIEQALRDAELPEDLVWLVAIESAFNPQAYSPVGAAGLFQFMPETGRRYGLAINDFVDERRSVTKSTRAGVQHLGDLYAHYRSWELALAAYNYGAERLDASIAALRARAGKKAPAEVEFKHLVEAGLLPRETANFVPQIHAFAIVAANRGRFGLEELEVREPFEFGEIAVPPGAPLQAISRSAGISLATLRDYNPDLLLDRVDPQGGDSIVNLPAGSVAQALAALPAFLARAGSVEGDGAEGAEIQAPEEAKEKTRPAFDPYAEGEPALTPPSPSPPSPAVEPARAPAPAAKAEREILPNGVSVVRIEASSERFVAAARIEIFEPGPLKKKPTRVFEVPAASSEDLEEVMRKAAAGAKKLVGDGGEASAAAQARVSEVRRAALARIPYGASWVALGEALFPDAHPLAGTALGAPFEPYAALVVSPLRPRGVIRLTASVEGKAEAARVAALSERLFLPLFGEGKEIPAHPKETRIEVTDAVPFPRVLFGWIAPPEGSASEGALRIAMSLVAHGKFGRVSKRLAGPPQIAARVTGSLELGPRASVVALEVTPVVHKDAAEVERLLDAVVAELAEKGPSESELGSLKGLWRERLVAERAHAPSSGEPRELAEARVARVRKLIDAVTIDDVKAMIAKVFSKQRVIVKTLPKR